MNINFKKMLVNIINIRRKQDHIIFTILGIKLKFRTISINRIETCCCIENLDTHLKNQVYFPHPVGVCICPDAVIGENCQIFQNVTIGMGKYNPKLKTSAPIIGNNVVIWANAVVIGGIEIGENSVIGANSLVLKDVPPNTVVAGNPARKIRNTQPSDFISRSREY